MFRVHSDETICSIASSALVRPLLADKECDDARVSFTAAIHLPRAAARSATST